MALIKRNTTYSVNDIVNTKYGTKLKCTTAGTTSTDPLILDGTSLITDGTVVWEVQEEGGSGQGLVDYAPNTSYNVGDIVIYDDKIYRCITAHTSTSTFDSTKWQKIGDEVFIGATSSLSGEEGIVPQPTTSDISKFLCGDGTWKSASDIGAYVNRDVLFSGNITIAENAIINLTNSYDDYDYLLLEKIASGYDAIIAEKDEILTRTFVFTSNFIDKQTHFMFNALSTTQLKLVAVINTAGSALYRITGIKFLPNPNNYSTTEREIGTWIDGKKLYQKTFTYNFIQGSGLQLLTISTLTDVDKVVEIFGCTDGGVPINASEQTTYLFSITCWFDPNSKDLCITHKNDGGDTAHITIKYTKV